MKLGDVKGERTLDVLADLIGPIANIAMDGNAAKFFERGGCPEGKDPREFALEKARDMLPALIRDHKGDLVEILATIKGVEPKEYAEGLNLAVLASDVAELLTDEEFLAFLS